MSDAAAERRRDYSERERLTALETALPILSAELGQCRSRLHDIAGHVAVLVAASEQAEEAHDKLARAIEQLGDKIERRIEQHDRRDDDRFAADGARLVTLEKQLGVYDTRSSEERRDADRRHTRRTAIWAALIGVVAVALASLFQTVGQHLLGAL